MAKLPEPPEISGVDKLSVVSLFWKLQVKVGGAGGEHARVPSVTVPDPLVENVISLSLKQAGTWAEISKPLAVAFSNFQLELVIISVFVCCGASSSLLQLPEMSDTSAMV